MMNRRETLSAVLALGLPGVVQAAVVTPVRDPGEQMLIDIYLAERDEWYTMVGQKDPSDKMRYGMLTGRQCLVCEVLTQKYGWTSAKTHALYGRPKVKDSA